MVVNGVVEQLYNYEVEFTSLPCDEFSYNESQDLFI